MSSLLTGAPRSSGGKCFTGGCMHESTCRGGRGGMKVGFGSPPPQKNSGSMHASVWFVQEENRMSFVYWQVPLCLLEVNVEWWGVWELTYTDGVLGAGAGSRLIGGALTLGTLWKIHQSLCSSYIIIDCNSL